MQSSGICLKTCPLLWGGGQFPGQRYPQGKGFIVEILQFQSSCTQATGNWWQERENHYAPEERKMPPSYRGSFLWENNMNAPIHFGWLLLNEDTLQRYCHPAKTHSSNKCCEKILWGEKLGIRNLGWISGVNIPLCADVYFCKRFLE